MSLEKSELKALMADNFAADLFAAKEKSDGEVHRHTGQMEAYSKAKQMMTAVSQNINDEIVKAPEPPFDPTDLVSIGKWVVSRFMGAANEFHKLAESAAKSSVQAEGMAKGIEIAINRMAAVSTEERNKVDAAKAALASGKLVDAGDGDMVLTPGPGAPRVPGQHPGPPMKAQRQAAENDEKKTAKPKRQRKSKASSKTAPKTRSKKVSWKLSVKKLSKPSLCGSA